MIGLAYQIPGETEEADAIDYFTRILYGDEAYPPGEEDSLAKKLEIIIEKEHSQTSDEDEGFEDDKSKISPTRSTMKQGSLKKITVKERRGSVKIDTSENSAEKTGSTHKISSELKKSKSVIKSKSRLIAQSSMKAIVAEKSIEMIALPGIWTPLNSQSKVLAMKLFFPAITSKFDLPEPEVIPPHLVVAFDAFKKKEILELAAEYPEETMRLGFFTSADIDEAVLIANTPAAYDQILAPP